MPEKILYAHDSGQHATGYRVLARSENRQMLSDSDVVTFVQQLGLRPVDLEGGIGWIWRKVKENKRIFARIDRQENQAGAQTLEYRILVLSEAESASVFHQPFEYSDLMDHASEWSIRKDGNLSAIDPRLVDAQPNDATHNAIRCISLPWALTSAFVSNLLRALVDSVPMKQRASIEFTAPLTSSRNPATVHFETSQSNRRATQLAKAPAAQLPKRHNWALWGVVFCVIAISIGVIFGVWRKNSELQQTLQWYEARLETQINSEENASMPDDHDILSESVDKYADKTHRQLEQLFKAIHQSKDLVPEDEEERIQHYLSERVSTDERLEAIDNALEKWIAVEKAHNTELRAIRRQRQFYKELNEELEKLSTAYQKIDQQLKAHPLAFEENRTAPEQRLENTIMQLEMLVEKINHLISQHTSARPEMDEMNPDPLENNGQLLLQ